MAGEAYLDYVGMQRLTEKLLAEIKKSVPVGAIMAWSGSATNVPTGWALCNGQNGTPDLQGRFILGASSSHAVGQKGGSETHTITINEMPAHTHTESGVTSTTSTLGGSLFSAGEDLIAPAATKNSGSTGGGAAMSIMPPYYSLAYIMKISG